jgi:hypothetical protein
MCIPLPSKYMMGYILNTRANNMIPGSEKYYFCPRLWALAKNLADLGALRL